MWSKLIKVKYLIVIGLAIALIAAVACASDEVEPPVPASEIAKIVQDAVAAAPSGPTAADIRSMVSQAVADSVPVGTSVQEIRTMMEAVSAASAPQPGITRAEMEAAVTRSVQNAAAGQLTAAEVQRIVSASISALPAPRLDTSALRPLVQAAVQAAVPASVSAAEISAMVEAAVSGATAGAVTQGDMQALIARSVRDIAAQQLSGADVEKIVTASLVATEAAVAATERAVAASAVKINEATTAARAARAAADAAVSQAIAATTASQAATMAAEEAQAAIVKPVQPFVKPLGPGGYFDYQWDGPIPTKFFESPMSAALVRQGALPPIEERLSVPADVHIVPPPDEIGMYGGTMRVTHSSKRYLQQYSNGHLMQLNADGVRYIPRIGKDYQISPDGRVHTFFLREGAMWSSGAPLTSEDFRFTWEDINFYTAAKSEALGLSGVGKGPDIPYSRARDPITGNRTAFRVVDDYTFSFTFDSPNYTFHEGTTSSRGPVSCGSGWCWYTSDEFAKPFHEKYADPVKLAAMIKDGGYDNWSKLFQDKVSWTRGSYDTPEVPQPSAGAWMMSGWSDTVAEMSRNHYYYAADPEGNQLPYLDGITVFAMESRAAAIFRSMSGESDMNSNILDIQGIPLYLANMEKGDYSIYHWPDLSGGDHNFFFNQTFNDDPEIGRWIRTKDFRIALSLAIDRNALNETVFASVGSPQNYVVHPSSPYYPGARWEKKDAIPKDVARANQILDQLGLMDTDGDGFRNRLDGKGNLELYAGVDPSRVPVLELVESDFAKIGIKMNWKEDAAHNREVQKNAQYIQVGAIFGSSNIWARGNPMVAYRDNDGKGPLIGKWLSSGGKEGMAPTGPDPAWLPLSPQDTFPADPSGNLMVLLDSWKEGSGLKTFDPRRIEIGKEMGRISADEKYILGTIAFTGYSRGLIIKRNNFRNVPKKQVRYEHGLYNMVNYFENGTDNFHNPGNRSKRYTSEGVFAGGTVRP